MSSVLAPRRLQKENLFLLLNFNSTLYHTLTLNLGKDLKSFVGQGTVTHLSHAVGYREERQRMSSMTGARSISWDGSVEAAKVRKSLAEIASRARSVDTVVTLHGVTEAAVRQRLECVVDLRKSLSGVRSEASAVLPNVSAAEGAALVECCLGVWNQVMAVERTTPWVLARFETARQRQKRASTVSGWEASDRRARARSPGGW